jgi:hypothetical protein
MPSLQNTLRHHRALPKNNRKLTLPDHENAPNSRHRNSALPRRSGELRDVAESRASQAASTSLTAYSPARGRTGIGLSHAHPARAAPQLQGSRRRGPSRHGIARMAACGYGSVPWRRVARLSGFEPSMFSLPTVRGGPGSGHNRKSSERARPVCGAAPGADIRRALR